MEPKKNECSAEAPSQAVGQPDFYGISPKTVIYDTGDSFKRFMKSHTKTLTKKMISKKIIEKQFSKVIKQELGLDLLLGRMEKMSLVEFVTYLRLLLTISKSEEQETGAKMGEEKGENSLYVKTTHIKDDTIKLMRIMKGSLEAMKPSPGSELHAVVAEFVYLVSQDSSDQSQTTVSQDDCDQTNSQDGSETIVSQDIGVQSRTTVSQDSSDQSQTTISHDGSDQSQTTVSQDDCVQTISQDGSDQSQTTISQDISVQSQDIVSQDDCVQTQTTAQQLYVDLPPSEGQLENAVSHFFTNEGGTLYSPLHGVTVTIPPNAIPTAFSKFFLSMHFYLQPFTLMDDADPCSVIVWLHQDPRFYFLEEVTVKIPHAAVVDDSLCVLTWGEDKQWNLNTEVLADFSDGYHAVIKVKHFCRKVVAKRRNPERKCKKQTGSSKHLKRLKSGSFGTSIDEGVASLTNSTEVDPNTKPPPHQDVLEKKMKKKTKKKTNKLKSGSLETPIDEGLASLTNSTEADTNIRPLPRQDAISMECDSSAVPISSQDSLTAEENESGFKYCIACSMPSDRSTGDWKVQFAACQSNPTGISVS